MDRLLVEPFIDLTVQKQENRQLDKFVGTYLTKIFNIFKIFTFLQFLTFLQFFNI